MPTLRLTCSRKDGKEEAKGFLQQLPLTLKCAALPLHAPDPAVPYLSLLLMHMP